MSGTVQLVSVCMKAISADINLPGCGLGLTASVAASGCSPGNRFVSQDGRFGALTGTSSATGVKILQHVLYLLEDEKCDQAISDEPPSIAQSQEEDDDRGFDDAKYRIV
jgi:hypothetical protein